MDLSVKPEYRQFREEVRDFLNDSLSDDIRAAGRLGTSVFHDKELHHENLYRRVTC